MTSSPPARVEIPPLQAANFVERPNRFIVHARLSSGREVRAHLPDPGRLRELLLPGCRLWLRPNQDPRRRTRWSALLVESPEHQLVSLDTQLPNRLVRLALQQRAIDELRPWQLERTEFTWGGSRFDFLLQGQGDWRMALEVKSVTLVDQGRGFFPDAVTARGTRHLRELTELAQQEAWRAALLLVAQRDDARSVRAAAHIDPEFAAALHEARRGGVLILARRCSVSTDSVALGEAIPVL